MCPIKLVSEDSVVFIFSQWVKWPGSYWIRCVPMQSDGMDQWWTLYIYILFCQISYFMGFIIASFSWYLTLSEVQRLHFTTAMWRNLTSKSPPKWINKWINSIYSILTFDLTSNQFLHRLALNCLCIFFLMPYCITGTHLVTFHCSNVEM